MNRLHTMRADGFLAGGRDVIRPRSLQDFLSLETSSELSQCTERRIPPSLTRPLYRFASYSGMPKPTRAPTKPPTAPPTPSPASAPMIGPAAISGPTPGIAKAPMPAKQAQCSPDGPANPYAGSSSFGRLCVLFGCKVLRPWSSAMRTETSSFEKPADVSRSTAASAVALL